MMPVTDHTVNSSRRRLSIILLCVALMAATLGYAIATLVPSPVRYSSLVPLPEPRVLSEFRLVDDRGHEFSLEDLRGRWSLVFLGFASCPDVCPNALYSLSLVEQSLPNTGSNSAPKQFLFVSVDPERDTGERLDAYVEHFNPAFRAATGTPGQLADLANQLGTGFQIAEHEPGAASYDVYHSSSVVLVDPRGRLRGAFQQPLDTGRVVADLRAIAAEDG